MRVCARAQTPEEAVQHGADVCGVVGNGRNGRVYDAKGYTPCRAELDGNSGPLIASGGCIPGCADTAAMAALNGADADADSADADGGGGLPIGALVVVAIGGVLVVGITLLLGRRYLLRGRSKEPPPALQSQPSLEVTGL